MKVLAIIQARMGSTRLPGKMMMNVAGKPLIWLVINRAKQAQMVNEVVLATADNSNNKILVEKANQFGIRTFAGSENDVLDRFYRCAKKFNGNVIVRVTGDCPLIDPEMIDKVISLFISKKADYASNVHPPTYPDGMDVEVFSFAALEKAWKDAKLQSDREHVTPYIWKNEKLFKQVNLKNDEDLSKLRLTIDEKEDIVFINKLAKKLDFQKSRLKEIIRAIKENPELLNINNKFLRNEGYLKSLKEDKK